MLEEREILEDEKKREEDKKDIIFLERDFNLLETALEIRYSSLKLENLPIEFSTIHGIKEANVIKNFGVTDIANKKFKLKGCQCRIIEIKNRKFLELKNREIRLGLEIDLKEDGSFEIITNNYYYKLNIVKLFRRYLFNIEVLKNIFQGESFNITGKEINGILAFHNRIEVMKFDILENEFKNLEKQHKEKVLNSNNKFYSIALLNLLEENSNIINSWVNLKSNNISNIVTGDFITIERIHKLFRNEFDIKEKIKLLTPVDTREISKENFMTYRKTCCITLEKIFKIK